MAPTASNVRMPLALFLIYLLAATELVSAQHSAPVEERLASLERIVQQLDKQIFELNKLLRALLPPPSVEIQGAILDVATSPTFGQPTATVALIEFSDFECPFCGRHARESYLPLMQQYVQTGRVKYVFKNLPLEQLHPSARTAAEAALCANEQGAFWTFHDRLFANQKALSRNDLNDYARDVHLDFEAFSRCLASSRPTHAIGNDLSEAARLGLTATPAFLIGDIQTDGTVRVSHKIVGAQPIQVFQSALDEALQQARSR